MTWKRTFDVLAALLLLLLSLPLLLIVTAVVACSGRGGVLFRQVRTGEGNREFTLYKFRTMRSDSEEQAAALRALNEADGPLFKLRSDPRCTRVGAFLRRSSIDELPQLLNVLRGDMSLVGPRPALPSEVAQYTPHERGRLEVKPGLTGLWQVSGRSDLGWHEGIQLDLQYVEQHSLRLDLQILARTFWAVISGRGAY